MVTQKQLDNLIPAKKGDVRNPTGKPKGTKHINTIVQELMHDEEFTAMVQEGYKIVEFKGAPVKAIVKAQILKAIQGDTKAYDSLVKSGWSQKIEQENTGEQKLIIETRQTRAREDT